jgi:hypothetical protein
MNRRAALITLAGGLGVALGPAARPGLASDRLRFQDLYGSFGPLGFEFSETARQRRGRPVVMEGFLAPPLKAEARFFVLCAQPVSLCPFCQSDADWPQDIVVVYLRPGAHVAFRSAADAVEVSGLLELGSKVDGETGFVSQVRVVDAVVRGR